LIAISQLSELENNGASINIYAKKALRTIDNILLFNSFYSGQTTLKLEPMHVGSTIAEVAHDMEPLMLDSGCRTEIRIQRSLSLVDVDKRVLKSALQSLWQALLGTVQEHSEVFCSAQKTKNGVRISLTSINAVAEPLNFKKANPKSSQPITAVAGPATDLLAAHGMFELLGAVLKKTEIQGLSGFGVTLKKSQQLQML
jgi:hypothetical protein